MQIVLYDPRYKQAFIDLNTRWIQEYFFLEKEDIELFSHVDRYIEEGSMILFAVENDEVLATCMATPLTQDHWELQKLATSTNHFNQGIGTLIFKATMQYAVNQGAKHLSLVSNTRLKNALHIYEKIGFIKSNQTEFEYDRADIAYDYWAKPGEILFDFNQSN